MVTGPSRPIGNLSGPISAEQTATDAAAAIATVRTPLGVASTALSFSPARFGYPSSIYDTIQVTAKVDPVDVLGRALFEIFRDARVDSYQVMVERDGLLWDTEDLGLSRSADYSRLIDPYGQAAPGQSFPTPPPPRAAPTSRPAPAKSSYPAAGAAGDEQVRGDRGAHSDWPQDGEARTW
jgi:hypothetical protein